MLIRMNCEQSPTLFCHYAYAYDNGGFESCLNSGSLIQNKGRQKHTLLKKKTATS